MSSSEFQRIVRDLSQFGDSMSISCTKEGITFSSAGTIEGSAKITLKPTICTDDKKGESVSLYLHESEKSAIWFVVDSSPIFNPVGED